MTKIKSFVMAAVLALGLSGCATGVSLSPREKVVDLVARYEVLQVVALEAVRSPNVRAETRRSIRQADAVATSALTQLAEVSRGCERDGQGRIILVEAAQCQPNQVRAIFPVAASAINTLQNALAPVAEE